MKHTGDNAFFRVEVVLIGGTPTAGNVGVSMLIPAWQAIPKHDRRADAVRALAARLCDEAVRLRGGPGELWWSADGDGNWTRDGAMMLLDRRLVDRLRELGDDKCAGEVEAAARQRWSQGGDAPLGPWRVRLPSVPLATVWDVNADTGEVTPGAGAWAELAAEVVSRGLWTPHGPMSNGPPVWGQSIAEWWQNPAMAPAGLQDATARVSAEVRAAAAGTGAAAWKAPRWTDLAMALWPTVKAEIERSRARRPAVVRAVAVDVLTTLSRQGRLPLDDERDRPLVNHDGRRVGYVATSNAAVAELLTLKPGAMDLFRSLDAQRLIKRFILTGHEQWMTGAREPSRLVYVGGFDALGKAIGQTSRRALAAFEEILTLGTGVQIDTPELKKIRGLWTFEWSPPAPGRPSRVVVKLADALMPGFVEADELKGNARSKREARRLVPELRFDPPVEMVDASSRGAVYAVHRMVLVQAVDEAERMAAGDGFSLSLDELRHELARFGGGSLARHAEKVRDGWLTSDDTAPAMIQRVARDRYTLADEHEPERAFIEEGGRKRLNGRAGGIEGKRAKADAAQRVTTPRRRR
jgi:hypothetical protein